MFDAVVQELAQRRPGAYDWHVFGGGDPLLLRRLSRLPRTHVHGYYRAGDLPARLRAPQIALGWLHSCAVLTDGGVKCWGDNEYGQLGDGTQMDRLTAVSVSGVTGGTHIASAFRHSCAVVANGAFKCWGYFL